MFSTFEKQREVYKLAYQSYYNILLLTNCEVHTAKYLDRSFEVRTEWNEVRTKN